MTTEHEEADNPSHTMWAADDQAGEDTFDEDCSPTRVCRNARAFSFEGIAEEGRDLKTAWRETLEREGKLSSSTESIRDLVLGQTAAD
ncbi:MAG: hypothetical protein HOM37_07695 [Acidimicrobiaceae bacterium]|nr:hypothetical protein [Acidimicrobiaceae bacterium]